jgi:hypothetical protein
LPAYRYTCNQTKDKKAITPMNNLWHPKTEHYFLVGNDRIVGLASNYGHLQVRQDEGAPKILNYFLPALFQYGGGFGYLSDGKETLSTFYDGINNNFERIFGIGYFRKKVKNSKYEINQLIYAPFGDDPIIISEVIISNNTSNPVDLKWFEYWGCFNYQYSFEAVMKAIQQKKVAVLNDHRILLGKLFQNRTFLLEKDFNLKGMINLKIRSKSNSLELQKR